MHVICPTILAADAHDFQVQLNRVAGFAHRIQIDITDGVFAPTPTLAIEQLWWPEGLSVDIHAMYKDPSKVLDELIALKPHMIIVHAEAEGSFVAIADKLHKNGIKVGVALLQKTSTHNIKPSLSLIDHVLIFSGDLGHFGGIADTQLLSKVKQLKEWKKDLEFGWDGGVSDQNAKSLADGGVHVLNVGGFIQKAIEPKLEYQKLQKLIA
jgi:pentose-5-phosphate-3-epimerase